MSSIRRTIIIKEIIVIIGFTIAIAIVLHQDNPKNLNLFFYTSYNLIFGVFASITMMIILKRIPKTFNLIFNQIAWTSNCISIIILLSLSFDEHSKNVYLLFLLTGLIALVQLLHGIIFYTAIKRVESSTTIIKNI